MRDKDRISSNQGFGLMVAIEFMESRPFGFVADLPSERIVETWLGLRMFIE
jgi:hypothetical protein